MRPVIAKLASADRERTNGLVVPVMVLINLFPLLNLTYALGVYVPRGSYQTFCYVFFRVAV